MPVVFPENMMKIENKKKSSRKVGMKNRAAEVANTLEGLITAFILALVFMEFIMQAFRIPTGSMADTLMGAHFRLRCSQCGYKYDHGFIPYQYRLPEDSIPRGKAKPPHTRCPSCSYDNRTANPVPVANGDRILVLKCIYQFFEPKRWDVVVFKNPLEPRINYIKRLIAKPGESVEIIDGDIYIDGEIARKPPKVQNELWMPVYNNDYQPVRPTENSFKGYSWEQPFKNIGDSKWRQGKDNPTIFYINSNGEEIHQLGYDTSAGNDFRASYAYNDVREYKHLPYCSDLKVRFYANSGGGAGVIGISLSKYETEYKAMVDMEGNMIIESVKGDEKLPLIRKSIKSAVLNKPGLVEFANVDHQLIFKYGDEKLTFDLGPNPISVSVIKTDVSPRVKIFGSGKTTLSHIAVFRDIHYTTIKYPGLPNASETARAGGGKAFKLEKDQFFVLGDNSPNSEDARWWRREGIGNSGRTFREGTVPREYLVGKAMFVYWPSGFKPFENFRFGIVPNIGRMRLVYGGSNKNL